MIAIKIEDINNITSESGVIASLIHSPEFIFYSENLLPNHFCDRQNAYMYLAITILTQQNIDTVDAYNIINALESGENTRRYAAELQIDELQDFIDMSDTLARRSVEEYKMLVSNVLNAALRRDTFKKLRECEALCLDESEKDLEQKIYASLDDIMMEYSTANDVPPYADIVDDCWDKIKERQGNGYAGIPFKFPALNEYATLERGELFIFAAEAKQGNLMRIALETECDEKKYLTLLKKRATLCCKTLETVRHIIKRNVEKGLLPNYQEGAVEMDKQYCTMGILGLYEVIEAFGYTSTDEFGYISYTDEGVAFASKIFEVLNEVKDGFTNEYSFNIESVPAERAAVILCQKDNVLYDLKDKFIYSNQWIPLSAKCTIQEKLRLCSILDEKCSGGSIAHINLESNFPNTDMAWDMLNKIAQSGVIYFAFNTRINECKNHHGFIGTDHCPHCGEPVFDTYQRIVGYLVPSRAYSKDRFKEFNTRQWYTYAEAMSE